MIQFTSREGKTSCARSETPGTPRPPAAAAPSARRPALRNTSRRPIRELPLISRSSSLRPGQPQPHAPLECLLIQEVCQRDVLRHKPRRMDQDALIVALPARFRAGDELVDPRVPRVPRAQPAFDQPPALALGSVALPTDGYHHGRARTPP